MNSQFENSGYAGKDRRMQNERRDEPMVESWHFKKEISVSIIISVLTLGVAVVFAYTDLKRDVALIQSNVATLAQQDIRLKTEIDASSSSTGSRFDRIDAKLDRLIERSAGK